MREIENIRCEKRSWKNVPLSPNKNPLDDISAELFEIQTEIELGRTDEVEFILRGLPLVYKPKEKLLLCKCERVQMEPVDGRIKLQILVDRTTVEVFGNDGRVSMFICSPLNPVNTSVEVLAGCGNASIREMTLWKLKSVWS